MARGGDEAALRPRGAAAGAVPGDSGAHATGWRVEQQVLQPHRLDDAVNSKVLAPTATVSLQPDRCTMRPSVESSGVHNADYSAPATHETYGYGAVMRSQTVTAQPNLSQPNSERLI